MRMHIGHKKKVRLLPLLTIPTQYQPRPLVFLPDYHHNHNHHIVTTPSLASRMLQHAQQLALRPTCPCKQKVLAMCAVLSLSLLTKLKSLTSNLSIFDYYNRSKLYKGVIVASRGVCVCVCVCVNYQRNSFFPDSMFPL